MVANLKLKWKTPDGSYTGRAVRNVEVDTSGPFDYDGRRWIPREFDLTHGPDDPPGADPVARIICYAEDD